MSKLQSKVITSSEDFAANRAAHLQMIDDVRQVAEAARMGGGEKSLARHESRGKMLPRRRVAGLLDPGSPFLEVGAPAAHGRSDRAAAWGGGAGRTVLLRVVWADGRRRGASNHSVDLPE